MPQLKTVQRSLLIEPPNPIRAAMDVEKLESLAASIRRYGIVLPLAVTGVTVQCEHCASPDDVCTTSLCVGTRLKFEIIDGHRRYVASGMVGLQEIPVNVFDSVEDAKFGIMLDTNVEREDITAAEEGIQFLQIAELRTWGIDDLMRHFGKSEDYINRRVRMVQDFPDVVTPVVERRINWSQASAIMRCPEKNYRAYMIDQADTHGASARTLTYMVDQWKSQAMIAAGGAAVHTPEHALPVVVAENPRCLFCTRDDDPANIVQVPVHSYHRRDLETFLERTGINRPERSTAG